MNELKKRSIMEITTWPLTFEAAGGPEWDRRAADVAKLAAAGPVLLRVAVADADAVGPMKPADRQAVFNSAMISVRNHNPKIGHSYYDEFTDRRGKEKLSGYAAVLEMEK